MQPVPRSVSGLSRHDARADRARKRDQTWKQLLLQIAKRDGNQCRVCKHACRFHAHQVKYYGDPHHIILRARGGGDSLENVCMLCRRCHDLRHVHGTLAIEGDADARDSEGRLNGLTVSRLVQGKWLAVGRR